MNENVTMDVWVSSDIVKFEELITKAPAWKAREEIMFPSHPALERTLIHLFNSQDENKLMKTFPTTVW